MDFTNLREGKKGREGVQGAKGRVRGFKKDTINDKEFMMNLLELSYDNMDISEFGILLKNISEEIEKHYEV